MRVKNVNGIVKSNCKCGTWLKHWEKFSGEMSLMCSEDNCSNFDLLGTFVQKSFGDKWYIIPLCKTHFKEVKELEVSNSTILVSTNISETCNK